MPHKHLTWFQQSAYRWDGDGPTIYIDPWGVPDEAPTADVVFITHAHSDHFSFEDLAKIRADGTRFVAPRDIANDLSGKVTAVRPGDSIDVGGVSGQAVHAYNNVEGRLGHHPKANGWVGYVLTLGDATYYHAGDTDHVPELEAVKAQVALLPIGGTYTMNVDEAARLAKSIAPEVAIPMHYGGFFPGVGAEADGEAFKEKAAPVRVELLTPVNPFVE
ncbi:MAG: MBL fold metallo-hydrolase [Actinomycetota bacterium]